MRMVSPHISSSIPVETIHEQAMKLSAFVIYACALALPGVLAESCSYWDDGVVSATQAFPLTVLIRLCRHTEAPANPQPHATTKVASMSVTDALVVCCLCPDSINVAQKH